MQSRAKLGLYSPCPPPPLPASRPGQPISAAQGACAKLRSKAPTFSSSVALTCTCQPDRLHARARLLRTGIRTSPGEKTKKQKREDAARAVPARRQSRGRSRALHWVEGKRPLQPAQKANLTLAPFTQPAESRWQEGNLKPLSEFPRLLENLGRRKKPPLTKVEAHSS